MDVYLYLTNSLEVNKNHKMYVNVLREFIDLTVSIGIVLQLLNGSLYFNGSVWSLYSVRQVEFFARPLGYTMPLNTPLGLTEASFMVISMTPERHCILTVGSCVNKFVSESGHKA